MGRRKAEQKVVCEGSPHFFGLCSEAERPQPAIQLLHDSPEVISQCVLQRGCGPVGITGRTKSAGAHPSLSWLGSVGGVLPWGQTRLLDDKERGSPVT